MKQFSGWSEEKLKELKHSGRIRGYTQNQRRNIPHKNKKNIPAAANNRSAEKTWLSWNLGYWANEHAVKMKEEFRFDQGRKFRFDYAFESLKIGIEYEGIFSEKSRHTTAIGYTGDTDKYNLAQQLGWRVIRLTAINYKTVLQQLNAYIQ